MLENMLNTCRADCDEHIDIDYIHCGPGRAFEQFQKPGQRQSGSRSAPVAVCHREAEALVLFGAMQQRASTCLGLRNTKMFGSTSARLGDAMRFTAM